MRDRDSNSSYRVTVKGLCVVNGRLLLVRENERLGGKWELPGGGLHHGEGIADGLRREIQEEMGLEIINVSKAPIYVWPNRLEMQTGELHTLVIAYAVSFSNLSYKPGTECESIALVSPEELRTIDLHQQAAPLRKLFDLSDFAAEDLTIPS